MTYINIDSKNIQIISRQFLTLLYILEWRFRKHYGKMTHIRV